MEKGIYSRKHFELRRIHEGENVGIFTPAMEGNNLSEDVSDT